MSNSINDIPVGLKVPSQVPLDAKLYKLSQAELANLGASGNLAYTYYKGMIAYCAQEQTRWEWREPKYVGEPGLLVSNFTYPNNLTIFGIDYSQKQYNFFPVPPGGIAGPPGPQGPQGLQGIQGTPGAVGPAGLNWQGSWVSGDSYVEDDAVGYNGASWFCILATSGTTTPDLDTTHWALLAAQGAQGPQGIQGPPGTGGAVSYDEETINTTSQASASNLSSPSGKIIKNFTKVFVISSASNFIGLSDTGKSLGESFTVRNMDSSISVNVVLINNARLTGYNGFDTTQAFEITPNSSVRFTLSTITGGNERVFIAEILRPLGELNITENLISNTNSAPFPYSNLPFVQFPSSNSYALPPRPYLGEVKYIKVAFGNCTLYASPNPGVDGANNNFLNPTGNSGNISFPLLAGRCYRCTYVGRFGGTFGFWTIEIMNNI